MISKYSNQKLSLINIIDINVVYMCMCMCLGNNHEALLYTNSILDPGDSVSLAGSIHSMRLMLIMPLHAGFILNFRQLCFWVFEFPHFSSST